MLCSGEILACAGVDLENFAFIDEERNLNYSTGFESCGLESVGCGVTCKTGVGLGNGKLNKRGGFYCEYVALVGNNAAHHFFLYELEIIAELVRIKGKLLESFHIHKVVKFAVIVEILHILALYVCVFVLIGGAESLFNNSTGDNILKLCSYESCALAGFNVLELNNLNKNR